MTIQCPKCGDPSPWHRDTCELKWGAAARFNSEAEALECAQPDVHLYDAEGCFIKEATMQNIVADALAAYAGTEIKTRTLTRDKGLVVEVEGSRFQLTIRRTI